MVYQITLGIPLYQASDYILSALESALEQTFTSVEFLIVDDCSTDSSLSIVEELCQSHSRGADIRVLKNAVHSGVGATRNRIINEAHGKYLFFMDSDDTIEPNTLQLLFDNLQRSQAEVAYASYEIIDGIGNEPVRIFRKPNLSLSGEGKLAKFAFSNSSVFHVSVCNCLISLDFLRTSGVKFINAPFWEDMAFTYEFLPKVTNAVLLSDVTYHYLRRSGSLSHYQNRIQLKKEEIICNTSTLNYMKCKCQKHKGKDYLPYLCYNLEMHSFYVVCYVLKSFRLIEPRISFSEMKSFMKYPLALGEIMMFKRNRHSNLLMWLLSKLPVLFFVPTVWVLGKYKHSI